HALRRHPVLSAGAGWTIVQFGPTYGGWMSAETPAFDPVPLVAEELGLPLGAVAAVVRLLAEGATVPFIARYRKEATSGLDEVQIRSVEERRTYLLELEARRGSVLAEIEKQGKLTPELRN